ncbi:MAG: protein-L-isoaspartate(D-aspartate) O-methyltransferase [Alphaproteobacteria bacterium]
MARDKSLKDGIDVEREKLLAEIAEDYRDTARWTGKAELSAPVRKAFLKVPREAFIPHEIDGAAYANRPLPIGFGQTISQPYIVAIMTELLELTPESVVLEVGTGCGYQTAILAEIAKQVYSLEVIEELAEPAARRLQAMGYRNVEIKTGDGFAGWPEKALFDAIIVTAAAAEIPPPLLGQLKPGGRMVIPIGQPFESQNLTLVTKEKSGRTTEKAVLPVAFVPLVREHAKD